MNVVQIIYIKINTLYLSLRSFGFVFYPQLESSRRRAYGLVAQAYTSISAEDFASFVGYSVEEAVKGKLQFKKTNSTFI